MRQQQLRHALLGGHAAEVEDGQIVVQAANAALGKAKRNQHRFLRFRAR
jgi:hypothetical protein